MTIRRVALLLATSFVLLAPSSVFAQPLMAVNGVSAPTSVTIVAGATTPVTIANGPGSPTDWVALYVAGAADGAYIDWRYLNGATVPPGTGLTEATFTFTMPVTPGAYELRLFANDGFTRLATSGPVTVVASPAEIIVNGISPPTAASASAGTIVTVDVNNGPANPGDWVGFYAAGAPDGTYLSWRYLNNLTSQPAVGSVTSMLTFQAPSAPGSYEFRFFTANSFARLATSTTLVIGTSMAQLVVNGTAPPASVTAAAGSVATVTVSDGPGNAADWVAFAAVGAAANAYVDWRYLNGTTVPPQSGVSAATLTFAMPSTAGAYEFRLFANNSFDQIATSSTVTVLAPTAQITINGIAPPADVTLEPGATLTVGVTGGPANATDWISLAYASAPASSSIAWMYLNGSTAPPASGLASATLSFTLPASPGTYEVRLFANNGFNRFATSSPIAASSVPPEISVTLTSPFQGTIFSQPPALTLVAEASATAGTITGVDFFAGATLVGSATQSPYTVSWTSPPLGDHLLTAVATHSTAAPVISQPVRISIWEPDAQWPGILGAPIATPPAGSYGPGQAVTLAAAAGASIRFTTDGAPPDETSAIYSGPITLTADTIVRAQAFQSGWADSGGMFTSYTIDLEPPTIHSILSPLPNSNGWNNTSPVTVSFVCSDPGGVQICPEPVSIDQQGLTEFVSGAAVDAYGHESTTTVTVQIDSIAPTMSLDVAPENDASVSASTITISGLVGDVLSEVAAVRCNGQLVSVNNGSVTCDIPLTPGLNSVVMSAVDAAGNTVSLGRRVTYQGTPNTLAISPDNRMLFIGETGPLTATSEFGPVASGVTWASSDDTIASIAEDGGVTVTGHQAGEVTLTATLNTLSATTSLRVVASGSPEASTAVRWALAPIPGLIATRPIYANRVEDAGPDLFDVNTAYDTPTVVRALQHDGAQVWSATVLGTPLFGDVFGGMVVRDSGGTSLFSLGGSDESGPWRYESAGNLDYRAAQANDGTIYQVEYVESSNLSLTGSATSQSYVVGIDGRTGVVKFRVPVPSSTSYTDLDFVRDHDMSATSTTSPVVGPDGDAYVGFIEHHKDWRSYEDVFRPELCGVAPLVFDECPQLEERDASGRGTFSRSDTVKLMRISPSGGSTVQTLWQTSTAGADTPERVYSEDATTALSDFTVDEDGAVLFQVQDARRRWVRDPNNTPSCPFPERDGYCFHYEDEVNTLRLARVNGASLSTRTLDTGDSSSYWAWPLKLVGDEHTAFLQYESETHAIDTQTLNTKWTRPSECCEPLTAMRDGGVAIAGFDGVMRGVAANGSVTAVGPMSQSGAEQTALGLWVGLSSAGGQAQLSSSLGPQVDDSLYAFQTGTGNTQRRSAGDPIYLDNREGTAPVLIKLETCASGFAIVPPGGITRAKIDGVKPAVWLAAGAEPYSQDWYKIHTGLGVRMLPSGSPERFATTAGAIPLLLLPECHFGGFCNDDFYQFFGGRKKEPEWHQRPRLGEWRYVQTWQADREVRCATSNWQY